jgi:uncharacterized protein (UPF0332 family)
MNKESLDLWDRGKKALHAAQTIVDEDPDSSASRSYYAAFHAVSALFALDGKTFTKHSALESAVHKELVKSGIWLVETGKDFSWLASTRNTGDYGGGLHVCKEDAILALQKARRILESIQSAHPEIFNW